MRSNVELPDIADLPQTTCLICGRSKICGLFTPLEITRSDGRGPRCRKCIGEISEKLRQQTWRRTKERKDQ